MPRNPQRDSLSRLSNNPITMEHYPMNERIEQANGITIAGDHSFLNHFGFMGNLTVSASRRQTVSSGTLPSHSHDRGAESPTLEQ